MGNQLGGVIGTLGHDLLTLAGGMLDLISDIVTLATGGSPQPKAQYPWNG